MDSPRAESPTLKPAAGAASAALYWFGTNLEPIPWLTWIAPLPVLLLALRVRVRWSAPIGGLAYAVGGAPTWWYLLDTIKVPVPAVLGMAALAVVMAGAVVGGFGLLARRGRPLLAAVVAPSAWVALEFGYTLAASDVMGSNTSIAYTQADLLPVLQLVSVTGTWGITFLLLAVPAAIAVATAPGTARGARRWVAGGTVALLAATLLFGFWRIETPDGQLRAAALGRSDTGSVSIEEQPEEAAERFALYDEALGELAADGVEVAVLPEIAFRVDDPDHIPGYLDDWGGLAERHRVDIVAGLMLADGEAAKPGSAADGGARYYNAAVHFPADGGEPTTYRKMRTGPGVGDWLKLGDELEFVPGTGNRVGLLVCGDLDHPDVAAAYHDAGASVLLGPSLENKSNPQVDAWWHSRAAITRGVEQGLSLVRAAQFGVMTISDPYGRIGAEDTRTAVGSVSTERVTTFYSLAGDWFAWLCVVLLVGVGTAARLARRRPIVTE